MPWLTRQAVLAERLHVPFECSRRPDDVVTVAGAHEPEVAIGDVCVQHVGERHGRRRRGAGQEREHCELAGAVEHLGLHTDAVLQQ